MSEKMLRSIFVVGTLLCLVALALMTVDSLSQVANARTPQLTDQVVAGKQIWQSKNCNDCHTILGIGGYYAPELTKVMNRRGAAWLSAFLRNPQAVAPGTTMPNQRLSDTQVANLVAFFQWVSQVDTNNWPPPPMTAWGGSPAAAPRASPQPTSSVSSPAQTASAQMPMTSASTPASPATATDSSRTLWGASVYEQKGCSNCHTINGVGGRFGPDLSHIGGQPYDGLPNTGEFLSKYLENPKAQKPDALMPVIPMSQAEREALVQYLTGLK